MSTRYQRPARVAFAEAPAGNGPDGAGYLASLPAGPVHALDPIGYLIWWTAVEVGDEDEIVRELADATGADANAIRGQALLFLDQLTELELLQRVPGA